ncbi:MAG TPA: hypothetical protein VII30_08480 [Gemmatimonadaceae bacterium]
MTTAEKWRWTLVATILASAGAELKAVALLAAAAFGAAIRDRRDATAS